MLISAGGKIHVTKRLSEVMLAKNTQTQCFLFTCKESEPITISNMFTQSQVTISTLLKV